MEDKLIIVFSGFNQRAIVAFIRTLVKNKLKFGIVAKSKDDPIFLTSYSKYVMTIRKTAALDLEDISNCLFSLKKELPAKSYLIAPSSEALNRFFLVHRQKFQNIGFSIPLVDQELYEMISDKYSFGELCKENGILIPKEYHNIEEIEHPFVAKPKSYFSDKTKVLSPIIVQNKIQKEQLQKNNGINDLYFQEFIEGESFYLLFYIKKDGGIIKFSQKNLVQQPNGKSIIAAISSEYHLEEESKKYENLFSELGFYGFIMIEIIRTGDKNFMIEANPRFWGPSQLFVDAGVNLFEFFLEDYGLITEKEKVFQNEKRTKYFWYGGLAISLKEFNDITHFRYYDNNPEEMVLKLPGLLKSDVYLREDTLENFRKELI